MALRKTRAPVEFVGGASPFLPENLRLQPYTSSSPNLRLTGRRVRAGSTLYFYWTPTGALRPTA